MHQAIYNACGAAAFNSPSPKGAQKIFLSSPHSTQF